MSDKPRFVRGPLPQGLSSVDDERLREMAAANPEMAKRYAETPINPDLYDPPPKFKMACAVDCPLCRQPITAVEDKEEDGQTVYVAEPCQCYLQKPEFESVVMQIGAWQDYVEDPDCDSPVDKWPKPKSKKLAWWKRIVLHVWGWFR